jgi:enolase-phosphatase E1
MRQPKFILTDIEGTTTPKTFVYDVLFPYFLTHLDEVRIHQNEADFSTCILDVKETLKSENGRTSVTLEDVLETLKNWVEVDRKHPALKTLQGLIWENGYRKGALKGVLYEDVPTKLKKWSKEGIRLGVYSSGSVKAQKLLFGFSNFGNFCTLFHAYFDTGVGSKREVKAYDRIVQELEMAAGDILFLSDIAEELDAASMAGMQTIQIIRDETTSLAMNHTQVNSFNEILWK